MKDFIGYLILISFYCLILSLYWLVWDKVDDKTFSRMLYCLLTLLTAIATYCIFYEDKT